MDAGDDQEIRGYSEEDRRLHVPPVCHGVGAVRSPHLGGCDGCQVKIVIPGRRCGRGYA